MKIVNCKFCLKLWIVFNLVSLCISSCSTVENDDYEEKEKVIPSLDPAVPVTVDFTGITWKGTDQDSPKDVDLTGSHVIIKSENTDPLIIDSEPKILALGENNSVIAYVYLKSEDISGNITKLKDGDKFRVIAYKKSDGTYHSHRDYVIGEPYEKLQLKLGEEYEVVSYTLGGKILPEVLDLEKSDISTVSVPFGKDDFSLVAYQKQDFTPSEYESDNVINVNMVGKFSLLGVVFRSLGSGIPIEDASFIMRTNTSFGNAKMYLNTGDLSCTSGCNTESKVITSVGEGVSVSYDKQFLMLDSDKKSVSLDAKVRIFGSDEYFSDIYFYAPRGKKTVFHIDLRVCGAYTGEGKTNFKRFMCNDLGGEIINPLQNSVTNEQHGDFYIWGVKEPVVLREYFQKQPQDRSEWKFDWSKSAKNEKGYILSSGYKFNGVCPGGWHVPSRSEWKSLTDFNNSKEIEGSTFFSSGVRIGENMVLSSSGYLGGVDGRYYSPIISFVYRWADSRIESIEGYQSGILAKFGDGMSTIYERVPLFQGHPVRCMKN